MCAGLVVFACEGQKRLLAIGLFWQKEVLESGAGLEGVRGCMSPSLGGVQTWYRRSRVAHGGATKLKKAARGRSKPVAAFGAAKLGDRLQMSIGGTRRGLACAWTGLDTEAVLNAGRAAPARRGSERDQRSPSESGSGFSPEGDKM
ncbi:hypothetical protein NDU88_002486 [Pleurodeles waltl]|uniref:Uncharacterized protein n=1 Tax=Pleurodeles waltl TaxID=8319 RepID=A0AAV7MSW7_PLEWA|nr:hypothetical protein NDU88_002486 [Pleurodeles waltl]